MTPSSPPHENRDCLLRRSRRPRHLAHAARLAILLALLTLLAACAGKPPVSGTSPGPLGPEVPPGVTELSTQELLDEAQLAYQEQHFIRSEMLYYRLQSRPDLTPEQITEARLRYADSAVQAGHPREALRTLQDWAAEDPAIQADPQWVDLYLAASGQALEPNERLDALRGLLASPELTQPSRAVVGEALAGELFAAGRTAEAMTTLEALHRTLDDPAARLPLEQSFWQRVQAMDDRELSSLVAGIDPEQEALFPYNLVAFEDARRQVAADSSRWPDAWRRMRAAAAAPNLVISDELGVVLAGLQVDHGVPETGILLALPLSGRYAPYGWKVLDGAEAARRELAARGERLIIRAVNTEEPGWVQSLEASPTGFSVVGGPLRSQSLEELLASGVQTRRAVFAFMPSLGDAKEGRDAWRFFASPDDQVRRLVDLAVDDLHLTRLAVLYPQEPFGTRMGEVFWRAAASRGATITGLAGYDPGHPEDWGGSVRELLDAKSSNEPVIQPEPDFEAVFIPDGWAQAQLLVPHLFYYDENRMVLLGPEIWCQAVAANHDVEENYFGLSACPGAWRENANPAASRLASRLQALSLGAPDFWSALGYDFVRLVRALGSVPAEHEALNQRLAGVKMDYSLAPFHWDEDGVGRQEMYLFAPTSRGPVPLDTDRMAEKLDRARTRHEERVEKIKLLQEESENPSQSTRPTEQ